MRASTMMPTLATLLLAFMASNPNSSFSSCSSSLVQALPSPLLDHLLDDPILLSPVGVEMGSHHLLGSQKSKSFDKHRNFDKEEDEEKEEGKEEKENEKKRRQLAPRSSPLIGPLSRSRPRRRSLNNITPASSPPSSASASASSTNSPQPRNVPMPLLRPRETDTQLGEKDEELEDASKNCGEGGMHDCFVNHEKERIRERRAEKAVLPSTVLAHGDGEREEMVRMMPRRRR